MSSTNMTPFTKTVAALTVVGAILGTLAFFNVSPFHSAVMQLVGQSATGSTFNTAKIAATVFNPSAPGATTTSILNTDANDRYVVSNFVDCANATTSFTAYSGTGLANFIIQAATTSASAPNSLGNTNLVMNDTIATGTTAKGTAGFGNAIVASSSIPANNSNFNVGAGSFGFVWPTGTYLTFSANATNTAQCTVGVNYIPS